MSIRLLNIQHVESLNDVVAQITHASACGKQFRIPIIDRADAISRSSIVTPEDLIKRLHGWQGLYPEDSRSGRWKTTFRRDQPDGFARTCPAPDRRTRVDDQLLTHMQAHAISRGRWAAGERVLVCVSDDQPAAAPRFVTLCGPSGRSAARDLWISAASLNHGAIGATQSDSCNGIAYCRDAAAGRDGWAPKLLTRPGGLRRVAEDDRPTYAAGQ